MSVEIERAIGRLESCVSGLKSDMAEVKSDMKAVRSTVDQARGGWKVLAAAATAGGVLGATLKELTSMLLVLPR